ncbi:bifunctional hydroxymethylpyrimidine kinase/phosphomethylpyrimidine kinase [Brevibacillus sp. SYP-B805]|uniref:bifunctional hydroxymethylpyrimidine kinase/phosphomethylpyrimidine kinase n=1 Tax=Brevibacillus sp. SYP-B805 TaxID=1578199 RepID=UPI0013EC85A9|nr:bifunctional hydroxymethylpyrimidine kinase/phosphomethylpyrimidine kinase [Brevibacillus sp. SYP-B805]NGQ97099.1 bifunctional hydroxymethylpyrimidine kinase/phosphomethylpyrimidine kinase [Brevibacillus sp. SYP-B805]
MGALARALTVAGSDSGGGAGIQADLKTFHRFGVYGMSAITAITAQNTLGVAAVYPLPAEATAAQMEEVLRDIGTDALKTGMLFSAEIIETVAEKIRAHRVTQVVVDPVMVAKGGAKLLRDDAIEALKRHLLPLAQVVTPNLPEAECLTGMTIAGLPEMKEAAKRIHAMGARHVMVKGGHLDSDDLVDLFYDGQQYHLFPHRRIHTQNTHGTGCTFSAALTAELAKGTALLQAVERAQRFIVAAIQTAPQLGSGHGPTNHWAEISS